VAERHAGAERRREQVRQRDDDLVGVALGILDLQEPFGAGAAVNRAGFVGGFNC
jgi:hypothetical protein